MTGTAHVATSYGPKASSENTTQLTGSVRVALTRADQSGAVPWNKVTRQAQQRVTVKAPDCKTHQAVIPKVQHARKLRTPNRQPAGGVGRTVDAQTTEMRTI